MRNKTSNGKTLHLAAPIRAPQDSAQVELTPPTSDGVEVEENVTKTNIIDIQRYLRWADKALKSHLKKQGRRGHIPPKAA